MSAPDNRKRVRVKSVPEANLASLTYSDRDGWTYHWHDRVYYLGTRDVERARRSVVGFFNGRDLSTRPIPLV